MIDVINKNIFCVVSDLQLNEYRTRCGLRFLSLHKPKRRRRPILRSSENASILDEHYNGQAKVSIKSSMNTLQMFSEHQIWFPSKCILQMISEHHIWVYYKCILQMISEHQIWVPSENTLQMISEHWNCRVSSKYTLHMISEHQIWVPSKYTHLMISELLRYGFPTNILFK